MFIKMVPLVLTIAFTAGSGVLAECKNSTPISDRGQETAWLLGVGPNDELRPSGRYIGYRVTDECIDMATYMWGGQSRVPLAAERHDEELALKNIAKQWLEANVKKVFDFYDTQKSRRVVGFDPGDSSKTFLDKIKWDQAAGYRDDFADGHHVSQMVMPLEGGMKLLVSFYSKRGDERPDHIAVFD
jgi:hypothetical protein